MVSAWRFRVNTPDVVHEIIEGEAVIVNLSNGMYYSVDRAGAEIWALVENGIPVADIVVNLVDHYTGERDDIEAGVAQFISQLQAESLIVPDESHAAASEDPRPLPNVADAYRPKFETPVLQRYADMEDLLLLDPIHDVDEEG